MMARSRFPIRPAFIVLVALPWFEACGDSTDSDEVTSAGGSGGARAGSGGRGGSDSSGGDNSAGNAASGGDSSGGGSSGGDTSSGGQPSLCLDVECPYGGECDQGDCVSTCGGSQIFCQGECIDPQTNGQFCGAVLGCDDGNGPNPQTAIDTSSGAGGQGGGAGGAPAGGAEAGGSAGAGGAPVVSETAGEHCAPGDECQLGECTYTGMIVGSTDVITRNGFSAQCQEWDGDVCIRPWIQIPLSSVVDPTGENVCIDDTTTLRPVWFFDQGIEEAQTFCWIATGTSPYRSVTTNGPYVMECGWMYGTFVSNNDETVTCSGFQKYSEVDSPGEIENIIWSFDLFSECRNGTYSTFECFWGE